MESLSSTSNGRTARRMVMRLGVLLMLSSSGCSDKNAVTAPPMATPTSVPMSTPTPVPQGGLNGSWSGTVTYVGQSLCKAPSSSITASFVQEGSIVTATLKAACWQSAKFYGGLSGEQLTGTMTLGTACSSHPAQGTVSPDRISLTVGFQPPDICGPGGVVDLRR
jgi:hypothetical protein